MLVFPAEVLFSVLGLDHLILNFLNLIVFLPESNLRPASAFFSLEELKTFNEIDLPSFHFSGLANGDSACKMHPDHVSVDIKKSQVEKRHWSIFRFF